MYLKQIITLHLLFLTTCIQTSHSADTTKNSNKTTLAPLNQVFAERLKRVTPFRQSNNFLFFHTPNDRDAWEQKEQSQLTPEQTIIKGKAQYRTFCNTAISNKDIEIRFNLFCALIVVRAEIENLTPEQIQLKIAKSLQQTQHQLPPKTEC